jgi:tetratricopeptide (TPR) repeat protein
MLLAPHMLALLRRVVNWGLRDSLAEAAAECALRLVIAIHRSGDYASALILAREAAELAVRRLGADNMLIFRLNQRIGRALFRLGRFDESETVHRQVLEECERALGADAPDTFESCVGLARPLVNLGRIRDAVSLIQRAIAGRAKLFGDMHPLTLIARMELLDIAIDPDMREIVTTGPSVIADCRRTVGEDHQLTLTAELNYSYLLNHVGRPGEALPYIRRVLKGFERYFDPDYPIMLNARYALSAVLAALGQYAEAIAHAEALVEGRTRVLGPTHPWTLRAKELLDEYRRSQSEA